MQSNAASSQRNDNSTHRQPVKKTKRRVMLDGIWGYVFFILPLLISLICEVCFGRSFSEIHFSLLRVPAFLQASAIFEAIKVIGFSTFLLSWVYNSLGKEMLAIQYGDLVIEKHPSFHVCSVIQISITIVCIMTSKAGTTESALLSFCAVIFGLFYQWHIIHSTIINSKKCAQTATDIWNHKINENTIEPEDLFSLIQSIPPSGQNQSVSHWRCFSRTFLQYCSNNPPLRTVASIWNSLLSLPVASDHFSSVTRVIEYAWLDQEFKEDEKAHMQKALSNLMSGYVVNEIIAAAEKIKLDIEGRELTAEKEYRNIAGQISQIASYYQDFIVDIHSDSLRKKYYDCLMPAINCIKTNFCVLMWVYVQRGSIHLFSEMVELAPEIVTDSIAEEFVLSVIPHESNNTKKELHDEVCKALWLCHCEL